MIRDRNPDRDRIAADVAAFLARGGAVQSLPVNGPGARSGKLRDEFNNRGWDGESRAPRIDYTALPSIRGR